MDRRTADLDVSTYDVTGEETELDRPVPSLERLVADAMAMAVAPSRAPERGTASSAAVSGADLADLVNRYWRLVPDEDLIGHTAVGMLAAVRHHLAMAEQRLPGQLKLTVRPSSDGDHTTVEIVTDDMPFLVDSVTAALTGRTLNVDLLVHPLVVVERAPLGALLAVRADAEPHDAGTNQLVESWIRVELERISEDEMTAVRTDLQRVLTDVREAVEDWPKMRAQALRLADELATATLPVPDKDITDSVELLRWLADDHFTFLGYREYRLGGPDGGDERSLHAVLGTGLGILRQDQTHGRLLKTMTPEAYAKVLEKRLLIITKANSRSTVHRSAYLDYIGFKTFDALGNVMGERRFLGLFTKSSELTSVRDLPVVKRKVAEVEARAGLDPRSHTGKDLMAILEDYPREELFQITTDDLHRTVMGVLRMAGRRQVRAFARKDSYGRFISCLVYLPRDRFTTATRLRVQEILKQELNGIGLDFTTRVRDAMLARIHYIVRTDPANPPGVVDNDALTAKITEATRLWDDDFLMALERKVGYEQARGLATTYRSALPDSYKDEHRGHEAVQDLAKLELLDEPGDLALHLFRHRRPDGQTEVRFKIFRYGEPMVLSAVLPVLHALGVRVTDERPYEIRRADGTIHLYDFGLTLPDGALDLAEVKSKVENAFAATWHGEAEVDRFNELVLRAGLTWRQVVVLRAYAKYLRQTGTVFSQDYMESTFIAHPDAAALLVGLFEARFNPELRLTSEERSLQAKELVEAIRRRLDSVASLDQDRILRSYLTLIQATLRTSFFQRTGTDASRPKSYVAFKLDPQAVPDLPAPRPRYEIFVYSPKFEGVHLRFGAVARGGLRWSDRREDFRTEILGLVKAQMVKNAVIVPVGAKGGFVLKAAPPMSDREAFQAEGVARYKEFISALLDVTDNLVAGKIVPPADVVRHDGDDPYLVVAADKGTATFSDIANEISVAHDFWLGDAFASGGSAGYDHKKMGITARGAWESVKRHFRDLGHDTQTEDFTVVGVGDMSGDVFGNGMLLSEHIRLVAAFDHRHIFVDPTPVAAPSYAERKRLFDLPRSSWDDYDKSLISKGGGVWPRTVKSIPITPEMVAALGLAEDVTALTPVELMKAILLAPVDLLWNGGIGTYVKATSESHAEVGDKTNDGVRVNGAKLRVKVVGEGGNLGLTQRGRIEFALAGGRICTDFIDNSAGVDCSDHEVNIKILLGAVEADGALTRPDRDALLVDMTDEVAAHVLRHNYDQSAALGNSRAQSRPLLPVHRRMITFLERAGRLDRALEALPGDDELEVRAQSGLGLTSPEFAVLLAYTKMVLKLEIGESELPDEEWTHPVLAAYFPTALRERYADRMATHPLRRDIVTTVLANDVVNNGGISFVFRAVEETGATAIDVLRAYVVAREAYGLGDLWRGIDALDTKVPTTVQTTLHLEVRRLLDRAVRWLVSNRRSPIDVSGEIARLRPGVTALLPQLGSLFRGRERQTLLAHADEVATRGVPQDLADDATHVMYGFGLLDIVEVAERTGRDVNEVAAVYFVLSEQFRVDDLLSKISALPREDRWQTLARMALRYDLYAALAGLTSEVLSATSSSQPAEARVQAWEEANASAIHRTRNAIAEFDESRADLAPLSVLLRQIRTLVRASAS
jgi:glutamate dehydrogenase